MNHSQMVQTRRRKQAGKKQLARAAKHTKKVNNQNGVGVGPATAAPGTANDTTHG